MNIRKNIIKVRNSFCEIHRQHGGRCLTCAFNYGLDGVVHDCDDNAVDKYAVSPELFFSMIREKNINIKDISVKVE